MRLSERITAINGPDREGRSDDGWGVFYRARALRAAGVPVVELTIGEHDVGTAPDILERMHVSARAGHTGYAAVPGTPGLRAAVARRYEAMTGLPTTAANVLITPGGQAALFAAHVAVCDPGDRALLIDPYYTTYPGTIRAAGAQAVAVPARAERGFVPDADDIDRAAAGARSLLINAPNNPTGVIYPEDTLRAVAALCRARDLWLISDEVYDSQVWDGTHLSPRTLPGMADRTLVVGSMSKSHAMTGSRCGWVIGPEHAIARLIDLATHTTYGVPGFIQDAAEYALSLGPEAEARVAAPFRRRRALVSAALAGAHAPRNIPTQGAMYAMLDIRATGLSGEAFALALLDAERIAVMPGESFGQAAAGHVRVALTVADDVLVDALKRLAAFHAARIP